jgi:mono/diheme cytochrome c family protein
MKHFGLVLALPLLVLAAPVFAQSAGQGTAQAGDAAHGKQLFMRDACYTCHGTAGEGGAAGPKIAHTGLPAAAILHQLREPQAQMPPYTAKILSDSDAADVVAYVLSLSQGPAPNAKDIPLLNQ